MLNCSMLHAPCCQLAGACLDPVRPTAVGVQAGHAWRTSLWHGTTSGIKRMIKMIIIMAKRMTMVMMLTHVMKIVTCDEDDHDDEYIAV